MDSDEPIAGSVNQADGRRPAAPTPAPTETWWARAPQVAPLMVLAWLILRTLRVIRAGWPYTQDDAYITLRYARNLASGHGLAWNVGELVPVEGYSNFLFVLLGAAALKLRLDPILLLKVLSCAALVPTWVLLYVLARRWLGPLAATLPAILLSSHTGLVFWAVSGLETTVFQLFVVAATTAFVVGLDAPPQATTSSVWGSRSRLHLVAAALCFLAALTRPEGPLVVVVLGVTALLDTSVRFLRARRNGDRVAQADTRRALHSSLRAFTLAFLVPYGAYFLCRAVHFGRLLPNTVYCKSVYNDRGGDPWALMKDFWDQAKVFILLALVQNPRKLGLRALPLFLLPIAYAAILFHADPVVGQFSRHFLAALALLVVASSTGLVNLATLAVLPFCLLGRALRKGADGRATWDCVLSARIDVVLVGACLVLHARGQAWAENESPRACAQHFDDPKDPWQLSPPYDLAYHASCYASRMEGRAELGRYLERTLTPQQSYVLGDVGIAPYLSHASVIDAFCLNSPELTRPPISFDRAKFIDSVFARSPDRIVVHSWNPPAPVNDELGFYSALVADPRFRRLYQRDANAQAFHAPLRGEGYFYLVYERRSCTLSLTTGNAACDACMTASCCSEANVCAAEPPCASCVSAETPSDTCRENDLFKALESCVAHDCSKECAGT